MPDSTLTVGKCGDVEKCDTFSKVFGESQDQRTGSVTPAIRSLTCCARSPEDLRGIGSQFDDDRV